MIPQIIPLTSDTPRLRQPVSRSPVARRHANALSTKAAQIPMALRHHERRVATRSAHTLEAVTRAFRTRLPPKVTLRGCKTGVSFETSSKYASKRAFRTRLPPKVTRQGFIARVSYETSSKSHTSSLQNERFLRDFLKNSHVKSPKRAFRTRLPRKLTCQSLQNERFVRDILQKSSGNTHRSTHITQPCQAVSRFQPLQTTPAHTPIPM